MTNHEKVLDFTSNQVVANKKHKAFLLSHHYYQLCCLWVFMCMSSMHMHTQFYWELKGPRAWCWERLKAGGEGDNGKWDGWMASLTWWDEFEQALGVGDGQESLACCSSWGHKESDRTERLNNSNRTCRSSPWETIWQPFPKPLYILTVYHSLFLTSLSSLCCVFSTMVPCFLFAFSWLLMRSNTF